MNVAPQQQPRFATLKDASLSDGEYLGLSQLVEQHLGISMPPEKRSMLETRLLRRWRTLGLGSHAEYLRLLAEPRSRERELPHFLDLATTNQTSFFRELPQLRYLEENLFRELLLAATLRRTPLRLWSAACSTGEEVWTLLMMLDRVKGTCCSTAEFIVWGSDVSREVLMTATGAKYDLRALESIPTEYRGYVMKAKNPETPLIRMRPELRAAAGFFRQNLMDPSYDLPTKVDVIFLRNALIYFSRERQEIIVRRALRHLVLGGLFVVSLTESLLGLGLPLKPIEQSIYRLEKSP